MIYSNKENYEIFINFHLNINANHNIPLYLIKNEIVLGIGETVNPIYFQKEIPNESIGDIYIN